MGLCGSKEVVDAEAAAGKAVNKVIEKQLADDRQQASQFHTLLLLGAGESGKSTLFKQMISIYGVGFPPEVRKSYVPIIHSNVIGSIKTLCEQQVRLAEAHGLNTQLASQEAVAAREFVMAYKIDQDFDQKGELVSAIRTLWSDQGIQITYDNRARYQLTDSTSYFLDRIDEIGALDYLPSEQDVLRSRVRTTGIVEQMFEIERNHFKMFDVGGQRNERKKWIHCFSDVTAVLFVVAVNEYDMVLFEDENTNRMDEALNLFDEIANSRWFTKTSMVLFLNKKDLFAEKIVRVPLTVCFPEYDGLNNYDEAMAFVQKQFLSKNKNRSKQVYVHATTATDKNNMVVVFNAVKDMILRASLHEGGLLME